ncbi:phosphoethanolamine transferase [Luteimonas sp. e5]
MSSVGKVGVQVLSATAPGAFRHALQHRLARRPEVSTETLVLAASVWCVVTCNAAFWRAALPASDFSWKWAICLAVLLLAANMLLLGLLVWRWSAKMLLSLLLPTAAVAAHYMAAYGVHVDADMVRNVLHTDSKEAGELLGWQILPSLLPGLLPLPLLWWLRIRRRTWPRALLARAGLLAMTLLLAALAAMSASQDLSSFLRNQREVRYLATPANIVVGLASQLKQEGHAATVARTPIGVDARQASTVASRKPRLLLLVVGETVRAANWGLNGYTRQTTPELAALGAEVINFPDVASCGSSTEVSLPCMFSPQGRADYDERRIRSQQSLLHVLDHAGIDVLWRDNQSGCKGVCDGLPQPQQRLDAATDPRHCRDGRCFDEILLSDAQSWLGDGHADRVVVLHMLGNHGPAYFQRYPSGFARFQPVCENLDLGKCPRQAIVNAYDNAIGYADHVLARAIALLKQQDRYDAALVYVSDHGESLGEKGLYLHGMPHAIAPTEQMRVPMIWWFSPGLSASMQLDGACLTAVAARPASHDNLFHSVLGLMDVQSQVYGRQRDLFAGCRPVPSA